MADRMFRRVLIGLATMALCGPASALYIEPPPARYDHKPNMPIEVRYESGSMFAVFCEMGLETGQHAAACAPPVFHEKRGLCLIVINERYRRYEARLIRHEQAHCNGWRHPKP